MKSEPMANGTRTIFITGGSRGIGAATAIRAAELDYDVCLTFHSNRGAALDVVSRIEQLGRRALALQVDLAKEHDITHAWQRAVTEFAYVDVLVNNAAIIERQQRLVEFELVRLQRIFAVNVWGSMLCAREAIRHMSTRAGGRGGVIINISSAAARLGAPGEYIDYAATKGAIDTLTIGLAKEVAADGIRVNAVRPGYVYTDIHASGGEPNRVERVKERVAMKRGGQPSEIADAILWLASSQAGYVTGSTLDVTGGL